MDEDYMNEHGIFCWCLNPLVNFFLFYCGIWAFRLIAKSAIHICRRLCRLDNAQNQPMTHNHMLRDAMQRSATYVSF